MSACLAEDKQSSYRNLGSLPGLFVFFALLSITAFYASTAYSAPLCASVFAISELAPRKGTLSLDDVLAVHDRTDETGLDPTSELLKRTLSPSFGKLAQKLNFLVAEGGRSSLDTEIHQSILASAGAVAAHRNLFPKGLRAIFNSLNSARFKKYLEELEVCHLQSAVCAARIDLKMRELANHASSLQWAREELAKDESVVTALQRELMNRKIDAHVKVTVASSLEQARDQIHLLLEKLELHFDQLTNHLHSAALTLRTTEGNDRLLTDARSKYRDSVELHGFTDAQLSARATEAPLTLDQLKVIEAARRLPKRSMGLGEWIRFIKPLRSIHHWRATQEILRVLPNPTISEGRRKWALEAKFSQQLDGLAYDPLLDDLLLSLQLNSLTARTVYLKIIDHPENQSSNSVALRFKGESISGMFERTYTDADLPILIEIFEERLPMNIYSQDAPLQLTYISKIISEKSVAYLTEVLQRSSWNWYRDYKGEMRVNNLLYSRIEDARNAMRELLEAEGPQSLRTPVTHSLTEIRYGRLKRVRKYM